MFNIDYFPLLISNNSSTIICSGTGSCMTSMAAVKPNFTQIICNKCYTKISKYKKKFYHSMPVWKSVEFIEEPRGTESCFLNGASTGLVIGLVQVESVVIQTALSAISDVVVLIIQQWYKIKSQCYQVS